MYHINDSFEVKPCGAQKKEACPFYGRFGNDNHYETFEEARTRAEDISKVLLGGNATKDNFAQNRNTIRKYMISFGFVKEGHELPQVRSNREIISKWFAGDEGRYRAFKHFVNTPEKAMTSDTKQEVVKMLMRGFSVEPVSKVREIENAPDDIFSISDVVIIEEDSDSVDLSDIRDGSALAFVR